MSKRAFLRGQGVSLIFFFFFDLFTKGGQFVKKIRKYDEKSNKTWSISTISIIIKTKDFSPLEKVCLGLLSLTNCIAT